jgi:tetratricopeptide (TPR) repeat protein
MRKWSCQGLTAAGMVVLGLAFFIGCQSQPRGLGVNPPIAAEKSGPASTPAVAEPVRPTEPDPLNLSASADLERKTEVEMVEEMARNRNHYIESLKRLEQFYDHQGNQMKSTWARQEYDHLKQGPQRPYLVAAELAGPNLRASKPILDADLLFKEGMKYYQQGRGGVGGMFADKKLLYEAINKFDQLITNYPESNMIDDAAFQIAQINHLYLKDYTTALLYYQRVWQWTGGQTTLPARFEAAKVYDEGLHNWPKALQMYDQAIKLETGYPANVEYAKNRIKFINEEMSKR